MKISSLISRKVLALVSLLLVLALLATTNFGQLVAAISQANLWFIALALVLAVCSVGFKTLRWWILLREKVDVTLAHLFAIQAAGLAMSNLSPGKLLEPFKVLPLKERGHSYNFLVASVFWERAFDMVIIFALALGVLASFDSRVAILLQAVFVLLVAAMLVMFRHSGKVFKFISRFPLLDFFAKAEQHDFRMGTLAASFLVSWGAWFSDFAALYVTFLALGVHIALLKVATAFSAAILVGLISFLPAGFGTTEAALTLLLSSPAYPSAVILAGVLLGRACTVVFSTLMGFALLPFVRKQ